MKIQPYSIGPLHDPVTWYGINYTGTQVTQWDFQNKGTRTSPVQLSFVLKVSLRNLRPSVFYSLPCDRSSRKGPIQQRNKQIMITTEVFRNYYMATSDTTPEPRDLKINGAFYFFG